jgi:hypothetical protein
MGRPYIGEAMPFDELRANGCNPHRPYLFDYAGKIDGKAGFERVLLNACREVENHCRTALGDNR